MRLCRPDQEISGNLEVENMTGRFRPERTELGEVPAEDIHIDPRSRGDVPKILRGIRSPVSNRKFRIALERHLEAGFLPGAAGGQGLPGMDLSSYV